MATEIKIVTKVVNALPTERPLVKGEVYKVKQSNGDLLTYTVNSAGEPVFERGIDNEEQGRLDQLTQTQITKLSGLKTQSEITNDIGQATVKANADLIDVNTTVLPQTPTRPNLPNLGQAWLVGLDGGTTYTQTGGSSITVPEGSMRIGYYTKSTNLWTFGGVVPLPKPDNKVIQFSIGTPYLVGTQVLKNGLIYEARRNTSANPDTSSDWTPLGMDQSIIGELEYRDFNDVVATANYRIDSQPIPYDGILDTIECKSFSSTNSQEFCIAERLPNGNIKILNVFKVSLKSGVNQLKSLVDFPLIEVLKDQLLGFRVENNKILYTTTKTRLYYNIDAVNTNYITDNVSTDVTSASLAVKALVLKKDISSIVARNNIDIWNNLSSFTGFNNASTTNVSTRWFTNKASSDGFIESVELWASRSGTVKFIILKEVATGLQVVRSVDRVMSAGSQSIQLGLEIEKGCYFGWEQKPSTGAIGFNLNILDIWGVDDTTTTSGKTATELPDMTIPKQYTRSLSFAIRMKFIPSEIYKKIGNNNTSDIYNKVIIALTDSIGADTQGNTFVHRIGSWSNASFFKSLGIGGATWAWRAGTVATDNPVATNPDGSVSDTNVMGNQVLKLLSGISNNTYPSPDLLILSATTNDVARNHTIGDPVTTFSKAFTSLDQHIYTDAIRWCVETLIKSIPNVSIFLVTPLQTSLVDRSYTKTNPYVTALKECASRLNVPVLDCFSECQISPIREGALMQPDKLHPNNAGQEIHGRYSFNQLKYRFNYLK